VKGKINGTKKSLGKLVIKNQYMHIGAAKIRRKILTGIAQRKKMGQKLYPSYQ
jgi:hypothetical protein